MRISRALAIPIVATVFAATAVHAAPMTYDVSFSANSFQVGSGGDPAPVDPVMGSFTITFDPTQDYMNETAGISLGSLNIALGSSLSFNYDSMTDRLEVGGVNGGSNIIFFNPSTDDFWFFVNGFTSGMPAFDQVGYTQTSLSSNNLFFTLNQTGTVTADIVTAPVPEPATLALALLGLAGLGVAGRRKRAA